MGKSTLKQQYPEHEKLEKVADKSQVCGEFLDWLLEEKGVALCVPCDDGTSVHEACYMPVHTRTVDLLAEFFGIDQKKLEAEKQAMLDSLRT